MTVVFSNSSNGVWRAIQEALGMAGFVVADVRTLDKQQGSYRQVTSTAVKQDLVISAYKPTEAIDQKFALGTPRRKTAWAFVTGTSGAMCRVFVEQHQRIADHRGGAHAAGAARSHGRLPRPAPADCSPLDSRVPRRTRATNYP